MTKPTSISATAMAAVSAAVNVLHYSSVDAYGLEVSLRVFQYLAEEYLTEELDYVEHQQLRA